MRGGRFIFALAATLTLVACNRSTEGMNLSVEGEIRTAPSDAPVSGADWTLFERAVQDGALQAEEEVAAAESDAQGRFSTTFPRRSSYSLRWTAEARSFPAAANSALTCSCRVNAKWTWCFPFAPYISCPASCLKTARTEWPSTRRLPTNAAPPPVVLEGIGADQLIMPDPATVG